MFILHTGSVSLGYSIFCHSRHGNGGFRLWWTGMLCKLFSFHHFLRQYLSIPEIPVCAVRKRTGNRICCQRPQHQTFAPFCQKYRCISLYRRSFCRHHYIFKTIYQAWDSLSLSLRYRYHTVYPRPGWSENLISFYSAGNLSAYPIPQNGSRKINKVNSEGIYLYLSVIKGD